MGPVLLLGRDCMLTTGDELGKREEVAAAAGHEDMPMLSRGWFMGREVLLYRP